MSIFHYVVLALSLAADAFAVSISLGIEARERQLGYAAKVGLYFGGFQAIMPLLGYLAGSTIAGYIEAFDHWIAFLLLGFIGTKMLWESLRGTKTDRDVYDVNNGKLFLLAVATSIDALAVGISLALLRENIWKHIAWIGAVTFALSFLGVLAGKKLGSRMQRSASVIGGFILIGTGAKILIEHLL